LIAVLPGCADGGDVAPPSADPTFIALLDRAVNNAESQGASEEQIALLERARKEGLVSYEIEHDGMVDFYGCLEDAGLSYKDLTVTAGRTFPRVDYQVFASEPTTMDTCYVEHVQFVDSLYSGQPAVVAEVEALVERGSADIAQCLRAAGYTVPDDLTYDELRSAAYYAYGGTYPDDPSAEEPPGFVSVDCYAAVGLTPQDYHVGRG
jgi:hypothetical protein